MWYHKIKPGSAVCKANALTTWLFFWPWLLLLLFFSRHIFQIPYNYSVFSRPFHDVFAIYILKKSLSIIMLIPSKSLIFFVSPSFEQDTNLCPGECVRCIVQRRRWCWRQPWGQKQSELLLESISTQMWNVESPPSRMSSEAFFCRLGNDVLECWVWELISVFPVDANGASC